MDIIQWHDEKWKIFCIRCVSMKAKKCSSYRAIIKKLRTKYSSFIYISFKRKHPENLILRGALSIETISLLSFLRFLYIPIVRRIM